MTSNPFRPQPSTGNIFKSNFDVIVSAIQSKSSSQLRSEVFLDVANLMNKDLNAAGDFGEVISEKNGTAACMDIIRIFEQLADLMYCGNLKRNSVSCYPTKVKI